MIYQSTPIITGEDFVAAQLLVGATKFKYENNDLQVLAISAMIGGYLEFFIRLYPMPFVNVDNYPKFDSCFYVV